MDRVRRQIGIPPDRRYKGSNMAAAVLDTGVSRHPDLTDRVIDFRGYSNCIRCSLLIFGI